MQFTLFTQKKFQGFAVSKYIVISDMNNIVFTFLKIFSDQKVDLV